MDSVEYLKLQIKSTWQLQDNVLEGLTDDQLAFVPEGTVSPIGVIWLHMVYSEDIFTARLMDTAILWESAGWKEKYNLEKPPDFGEDWSEYTQAPITTVLLKAYTAAVRKQTRLCLQATTSETLDETIKFFTDNDPKAAVWLLFSTHGLHHTGEISALKGLQGLQGLPF